MGKEAMMSNRDTKALIRLFKGDDMDTRDGHLISSDEMDKIVGAEKSFFKEVKRDLKPKEEMEMQIKLYSPCGCGSGKKFKFCCYVGKQMYDFMKKL